MIRIKYFKMLISSRFLVMLPLVVGLISCVSEKPASRKKTVSSNSSKAGTTSPNSPTFNSDEALYWFTSEKITGTITINKNSDSVVYLRGNSIHNFLGSKDSSNIEYYRKQFCLIGTYGGSYKQLRVRAVPISISNFSTKAMERVLRIDIPSRTENYSVCGNTTINSILPGNAAYGLDEICPSCLGTSLITSTSLGLYESKTTPAPALTSIAANKLSLSNVNIRVDLKSNSTSSTSTCTNSACEVKGFDCCIEGQCVVDASIKANAQTDYPDQYSQAMSDYAINPMNFINFPNIFNICGNISHTPPPTVTPTPTPLSAAEQRVKDYLADYVYLTGVVSSGGDTTLCRDSDGLETAYGTVQKKLAIACGCPTTYTCTERQTKCPEWGVRPLYKSGAAQINTNIIDFYCYTPVPDSPVGPITDLDVSVSGRSAPHRFYAENGTNYDSIAKLSNSILQEGDDFYYLDNITKTSPINTQFNINAVLGRMVVDLSQTAPAKMVTVELGKTYVLSSISGYFTPCSLCAKDSWFNTFSSHPVVKNGVGLTSTGYSTTRDAYGANTTYGNYEDTKFGRACHLPVTMIPFSHKKNLTLQTQRQNRLKTQTAFYVNGYQRDWFGFNQGALIGSFDGVSWFAVGTGRRVQATSTKLFLALNASFLDLSTKTDTVVNIIPDNGVNIAADFDYDPTLTLSDPKQNTAATCQANHQCATDADCVTKLGWEYTCADISQMKTHWPIYDTDAKESVNQEKTGNIFEILLGTTTMGEGPKRCVYRGAGAPCIRDFVAIDGKFNQKLLTCAPNFYCAGLSTNKFNQEVVRSPNELDDILFGMDTNILGRPLNYVTATKSLPVDAIANIQYNGGPEALGLTTAETGDMGICRPGRMLSSSMRTAHASADTAKRTDFISQVSSCDSSASGDTRTQTCPAFDDEYNYLAYNHNATDAARLKRMQNMCSGESKHTSTFISAFKTIEAPTLATSQNIQIPTMAQDACLRRAGSVCHTDLDCAPNKLHEEIVGSMSLAYFGGTEAERDYWSEALICGQGNSIPTFGSASYFSYNMSNNRCCREIGKDFTMYTQGSMTLVPENTGNNVNLNTSKFSSTDPKASYRYSRYINSETAQGDSTKAPAVALSTPIADQWKVINETGTNNCCGGGWIRKFSDGTHDWKVKNRLNIDVSNFSCLNFRSPLASPDYSTFSADSIVQATYLKEYEYFCKMPKSRGCLQVEIGPIDGYTIVPPTAYDPTAAVSNNVLPTISMPALAAENTRLDTSPLSDPTVAAIEQAINHDVPYLPFPYYFTPTKYDIYMPTGNSYNFFIDKATDYGVSMYLPAYIQFTAPTTTSIQKIYVRYFYKDSDGNYTSDIVDITASKESVVNCDAVSNYAGTAMPVDQISSGDNESWCVSANSRTQNRPVLHVKAYTGALPARQWLYASVIIDFKPLEFIKGYQVATPGNPYYYLSKLGRLELIGIPQITYEPLYCNTNQDLLVPGIFSSTITSRSDFSSVALTYNASFDPLAIYGGTTAETNNYGNYDEKFTYQNKLAHSAVFSSKDFTCCRQLGKETNDANKCCSGYAKNNGGKLFCTLPSGTDLHVYFNKFVSSEGVGENLPGGGLLTTGTDDEIDFISFTGEPKMRASTFQKIADLGKTYCQNGVVTNGGAFGPFPAEPYSGSYVADEMVFPISIVDSIIDGVSGQPNVGKFAFDAGFRWDHHYYCK